MRHLCAFRPCILSRIWTSSVPRWRADLPMLHAVCCRWTLDAHRTKHRRQLRLLRVHSALRVRITANASLQARSRSDIVSEGSLRPTSPGYLASTLVLCCLAEQAEGTLTCTACIEKSKRKHRATRDGASGASASKVPILPFPAEQGTNLALSCRICAAGKLFRVLPITTS